MATIYYRKSGIIPWKKLTKGMFYISLVGALVITVGFALFIYMGKTGRVETDFLVYESNEIVIAALIGIFIAFIIISFLAQLMFMVVGFGLIGILVALQRGLTPEILFRISKITKSTTAKIRKKHPWKYWRYNGLLWFFNIPYSLDTKKLKFKSIKPLKKIPWGDLRDAVLFQILFGVVIVVYISFNPFFIERITMRELISFATNITIIVPFIIIPWFIYHRLDVSIKGITRDFTIYHGIKHRIFRTLIALGTLFLIIRMGLKDLENAAMIELINGFVSYFVFFIIFTILFTFIYFNFFENKLARDVVKRFSELKK
jgi:hypothetical protein